MEIKILEPRSNSLHYFAKSPSITFKWQAQASATLMISRDRDFKDVLYQKEASGEILVSDLPFAHLYWKVVSAEGESELRTLKLKRDLPPTLIAPYDKARLSFEEGSRRLLFKWENQNTQGYEIEIDLKKETIKEVVNKNHFILAEAAPGAKDATRSDSAWSEYSYFEVESELKPLPTELLKPDDEARFEFFDQQTLASTEVTYSWQENKKAKSYQWILKKSGQIIETYESIDTALTRKLSQAGEFDWSVLSIDFYGKRSEESASRKLIVQLNENAFDKETGATQIQLKKPNQKVHFEWEGEKDREYLFELSETQDFSQIRIKKKSKSPKADFTFPKVGVYYWRTKKILPNGKIEYSRPKKVEVEPTPPPKKLELAPELELEVQRKKTTSIFSVFISSAYASNEFVKVSWPVEEEMKAYVIEIYQDQSMKKLILKRKTETNSIEWTNPPEGTFYYRVAQIDFWDRQSEFSNLSKISITVPDELKIQDPVKLTGPEDEEELLSKQKIYYFEWSTTENADSYMLEVAHDKEFTKVVYRKTVKDTKHAVREDIFRKHMRVFWRVSALGSYSQKVSSEIQILSLKIPEIAQAPKVEVVEVKKPQKPRPRIHPKFLRFYDYMEMGWQPSNITYTIDDKEFNGEITGLAKSSLYLKGRSIYKPRRFYDYYLRWQTGKTFEGQSQWLNSEFQFFMGRPQVWGNTKFVAKYGLQGNYFSAHKIKHHELLVDENKLHF